MASIGFTFEPSSTPAIRRALASLGSGSPELVRNRPSSPRLSGSSAAGVTIWYGAEGTGLLLILSQVVLAFQLPFAIVPLVMFTRDKAKMGRLVAPLWLTLVAGVIAAIIIALNMKLLWDIAIG